MKRSLVAALAFVPALAFGQGDGMKHDDMDMKGQGAFKVGESKGMTIGVPHVDLGGGLYYLSSKDNLPKVQEGFVRAHVQAGTGLEYLQIAIDATFVPKLGTSPALSTVLQIAPFSSDSPFFLGVGAGAIFGRPGSGRQGEGWAQGVLALRTPIHEIAPFVQVGFPFVTGARAEILVGIAHPLAPYHAHLF